MPAPSLLDRVVGWVSPRMALDRLHARVRLNALTGGYTGGSRDRRPTRNWRPHGGNADADTLPDLDHLRARSRDLVRNTPIATGAVATVVTNVIGDGLQLQASIDAATLGITDEEADAFERQQEREWALFCREADFTRVQHLDELQRLAYRAAKESGDVIAIRRFRRDHGASYGTRVQLVEADRLCNPNRAADTDRIAGGVETDADGVPVRYHIADRHPGSARLGKLTWSSVPARDPDGRALVLHIYDRQRPEMTRGVPYLAPVIEHLKQLGDYSDAEVTAAVVSAMFTMVVKSAADDPDNPIVGERPSGAALASNEVQMGNGATISLAPGEDVSAINPMRPNANFDPFVQAFLRQVGVALELPFELLIKHFTASYSASRAALEMAWQFFRRERGWIARRFCQEIYGWMMDEAVASGRLDRPGFFADPIRRAAWLGAEWIGPSRASLNPLQEANADKVDLELGAKTLEQVMIERTGGDVDKKLKQRGREIALARNAGLIATPADPALAAISPDQPAGA